MASEDYFQNKWEASSRREASKMSSVRHKVETCQVVGGAVCEEL